MIKLKKKKIIDNFKLQIKDFTQKVNRLLEDKQNIQIQYNKSGELRLKQIKDLNDEVSRLNQDKLQLETKLDDLNDSIKKI